MLTKSDLLSLFQCPRKLWLEHRHPELVPKDDQTLYRRAVDGRIVGEKAREQLPGHVWMSSGPDPAGAAASAREMLTAGLRIPAVEVPMLHDGLYARGKCPANPMLSAV